MSKKSKSTEIERDQYGQRLHAEKPTKNGHYMGKRCGFNYKDGRYQVAPSHYRLLTEATEQEAGLRAMIEAHNEYLNKQFARIAALKQRFWDGIRDDYEIDGDLDLLYHGDGWVSIKPKEEEQFNCVWCGLRGFKGRLAIAEHSRECLDHPLGKELRELRKQAKQ